MKNFVILVASGFLVLAPSWSMAAASPERNGPTAYDVSEEGFAKAIIQSLSVSPRLNTGGGITTEVYQVEHGLICTVHSKAPLKGPAQVNFGCRIYAEGGWRALGARSYTSASDPRFSKILYEALDVPFDDQGLFLIKTVRFDAKSADGTSNRSQLTCRLSKGRGPVPYTGCDLIDALPQRSGSGKIVQPRHPN